MSNWRRVLLLSSTVVQLFGFCAVLGHHSSGGDECPHAFPAFKRENKLSEYIGKDLLLKVSDGIYHGLTDIQLTTVAQTVADNLNGAPLEKTGCEGGFQSELFGVSKLDNGQVEVKVKCIGDETPLYASFKATEVKTADSEETDQEKFLKQDLLTGAELVKIGTEPESKGFQRLTNDFLQTLIDTSGVNTFAFLSGVQGFEGSAEDVMVSGGNFVELPLGFQYCIEVYTDAGEERKSTVLDIYQFKFPGTEPFLVFHPYSGTRTMDECNYFMMKIAHIWGSYA